MSSNSISWLHLSDFHTGKDNYAQRKLFRQILSEIDTRLKQSRKLDFIFISGDIANRGLLSEYKEFDENFIVPLVSRLGDEYMSRIFVVPGNHDVNRTKAQAVQRYEVLAEVPHFLDPTLEGLAERSMLLPRFEGFIGYSWTLDTVDWLKSEKGYLVRRHEIGERKIGILCVNTAWLSGSDGDQHRLSMGRNMLEQGLDELQDCSPVFVLGHHPLEWLSTYEAKIIKTLLSRRGGIYLHGHLHKNEHSVDASTGLLGLTLQAGCAFVSRNDEIWVPRLLWGSFDFETGAVMIEPRQWVDQHINWTVDSTAFPADLRVQNTDLWCLRRADKSVSVSVNLPEAKLAFPEGWIEIEQDFLQSRTTDIRDERLLQYFDGRIPTWEDILSERIPKRSIVGDLLLSIRNGVESGGPQLTVLLGAGGEEKSTAFLQALHEIARSKSSIRVLWRSNVDRGLPPDFVRSLLNTDQTWIFASDEGDNLVADIQSVMRSARMVKNFHCFLTCRDTDWIETGGATVPWSEVCAYAERKMAGLDLHDATAIVGAWRKCGERGLGKLAGLKPDEAVNRLIEAAKAEASSPDGAFLGAMLRVRLGMALRDHVGALLSRLGERPIQGMQKTLLDAFAYIAVPHAQNLLFMSRAVLARHLEIDDSRVRRRVVGPLGEEAAATSQGQYILTRHRAIAETAVDLLISRFEYDSDNILCDLVKAALLAAEEGVFVPHIKDWRYLSSKIYDSGNKELAIKLAQSALAVDPRNSFLIVKLAVLYRTCGQPELSVKLFRNSRTTQGNRAFYTEWSYCEAATGQAAISVWLRAISLADIAELQPPDARDIQFGVAGLASGFWGLYDRYLDKKFLHAAAGAADLGIGMRALPSAPKEIFSDTLDKVQEKGVIVQSPAVAFEWIEKGIQHAYEQREANLDSQVPEAHKLKYNYLKRFLELPFDSSADAAQMRLGV